VRLIGRWYVGPSAAPPVQVCKGWPHNALRYRQLMPIICQFQDRKALFVTSLASNAIARFSARAVEVAFKNLGFLGFLKNLKKPKSPNFRFFWFLFFFVSKNRIVFSNHILKVQKLELNSLNHIEFNHTSHGSVRVL